MSKEIDHDLVIAPSGMLTYRFFVHPDEIVRAVPESEHAAMPDDEVLTILETLRRVHLMHKEQR